MEGATMMDTQVAEQHEEILAGLGSERAHSRIAEANGRQVQWIYNGDGSMVTVKTPGQIAYEEDVRRRPKHDDGTDRPTWEKLGAEYCASTGHVIRNSWERNPTPRAFAEPELLR
jgi:hypothetical protein